MLIDIHILGQVILNWFGELCFEYATQIACMSYICVGSPLYVIKCVLKLSD